MDLHLDDQSCDVVSIAFGIRNVQDPTKAIAEFYRLLRPSGRLIVLEFSTPPNTLVRSLNNLYTKRIMPITASLIARDRSGAYNYLPKSVETFSQPEELANQITQAGFEGLERFPQSFGVCTITKAVKR
jgi:demethylmenaquinone methyltransferase/2-methoxy-6-polyprenyl-1,4-benzoquinol methylase